MLQSFVAKDQCTEIKCPTNCGIEIHGSKNWRNKSIK